MYCCSLCAQTEGATALHYAADSGDVEILKVLIEGGADMEITDKVTGQYYNIVSRIIMNNCALYYFAMLYVHCRKMDYPPWFWLPIVVIMKSWMYY